MSSDFNFLLHTVRAVRDRMATALAAGEPPLVEPAAVFGSIPGVAGSVADRMARLHAEVVDEIGDGGKSAVLIAAATAAAALDERQSGLSRLAVALRVAGGTAAEAVSQDAVLLRSPEQLLQLLRSSAGGPAEVADTLLKAFELAGMDGVIHVLPAPPEEPGVRWTWAESDPIELTVHVGGRTPDETAELFGRACRGLHAGRWAIAEGVLPGGGAAYLRAADALRTEAADDTVTAAAARAVVAGLEAPARALAGRGGDGLLDPLRVVRGVIRAGTAAAADLITL